MVENEEQKKNSAKMDGRTWFQRSLPLSKNLNFLAMDARNRPGK